MDIESLGGMKGPGGLQELGKTPSLGKIDSKKSDSPDFESTLKGFLTDVNDMQLDASQSIQKMVAGEVKDVHQVMLAAGEAKVAFNLMVEIRNKTMEAYKELMRMRG